MASFVGVIEYLLFSKVLDYNPFHFDLINQNTTVNITST